MAGGCGIAGGEQDVAEALERLRLADPGTEAAQQRDRLLVPPGSLLVAGLLHLDDAEPVQGARLAPLVPELTKKRKHLLLVGGRLNGETPASLDNREVAERGCRAEPVTGLSGVVTCALSLRRQTCPVVRRTCSWRCGVPWRSCP